MKLYLTDRVEVLNLGADADGDDTHGNPDPSWSQATALAEPATVQPVSSQENSAAEAAVVSRWRVFLSPFTTATSASRVRWPIGSTDVFEVDGEVQAFPYRGVTHHHEAFLRRVNGGPAS